MIAITGATGTNGTLLLRELSLRGVRARALARKPETIAPLPHVEAVLFDFERPETFASALRGVDRALLLTPSSPEQTKLEVRFIDSARTAGVKHIVYLSVFGTDAPHPFYLAKQHADTEKALRASGIAWTILRPVSFMQNVLWSAADIGQGVYHSAIGPGATAYIDARDIVDAIAAALTENGHEDKIYTLTGPEALSAAQLAQKLSEGLGRSVRFADLSRAEFEAGALGSGMPQWYASALGELFENIRSGQMSDVTNAVAEVTGHAPRTLAEFVRDHADRLVGRATPA